MSGVKRLPSMQARFDAWGHWVVRGVSGGPMHPIARLMDWKAGKRVSASGSGGFSSYVPVDEVECSVTDEAIRTLPRELQDAVRAWHVNNDGTLESVAQQLGVVRGTLHRRLCQADQRVQEWIMERRNRLRAHAQ